MYRRDEPELNVDQVLERLRSFFGRFRIGGGGGAFLYGVLGILAVAAIAWLGTGIYSVQPGEQAALRILGKFDNIQDPGLHWWWPAPIGTRAIVAVAEVRRLELGFRGASPIFEESLMITGDENIVDAQLLIQYDIKDIEKFLFRSVDPDGAILHSVAETSLRQVVGLRNIDDVLTTEKEAVQADTRVLLQSLLDLYETGINVREVKLQNVRPPPQVQDAFDDVVRAREEKEQIINLAQAYEADVLPKAEGEATKLRKIAEGFKAERIARATGQATRFTRILEEYRKSPDVTRQRMYLEAMEEILPGVTMFVPDPGVDVIIVANESGAKVLPLSTQQTGQ